MSAFLLGSGAAGGLSAAIAVVLLLAGAVAAVWAVIRGRRGIRGKPPEPALRTAVDGALISLGVLAVLDNVVFHWLLQFHRFKEGWPGSVYVELLVVGIGILMAVFGTIDLRRHIDPAPKSRRME